MDGNSSLLLKRCAVAVACIAAVALFADMLAQSVIVTGVSAETEHIHIAGTPGAFFDNLFKVYTPRQVCMFNEASVIWLHFIADFLIATSYFSIPVALVYFIRRRSDLAFTSIFWMFAAFILLCGTTHLVAILDLWHPLYKIEGIIKLLTGLVSVTTAIVLWPLIPKALALPSPALLEQRVHERTAELALANEDRQKAFERERALREEAESANRIKDEFLATLSHELRTPLNAIAGWSQILKRRPNTPEQARGLEVIERNTRAQVRLIEDLLDLSRIIKGNVRLDIEEVNPEAVIDAAIDAVRPAADAKAIRLQKQIDPCVTSIKADASRLQQVVWNLLTNAVKFTPQNGQVQISLRQLESHIEIEVADNGIGVTSDFLPFIFNRFRQADSSSSRKYGGLGIGLAIARHLVELHGGSIRATSPGLNHGTTFVVSLPSRPKIAGTGNPSKPDHSQASNTSIETISLRNLKILAIDDEEEALILLRMVLEQKEAVVLTAPDSERAFEILQSERPDIILCDLGMPKEDGYAFLKRVRTLPAEKGGATPAIAVTAFARAEDRLKVERAGFKLHIVKPIDQDLLIHAVAKVCGRL